MYTHINAHPQKSNLLLFIFNRTAQWQETCVCAVQYTFTTKGVVTLVTCMTSNFKPKLVYYNRITSDSGLDRVGRELLWPFLAEVDWQTFPTFRERREPSFSKWSNLWQYTEGLKWCFCMTLYEKTQFYRSVDWLNEMDYSIKLIVSPPRMVFIECLSLYWGQVNLFPCTTAGKFICYNMLYNIIYIILLQATEECSYT